MLIPTVHDAVATIISDIRSRGDAALLELTAKFDNLNAEHVADLAVNKAEIMQPLTVWIKIYALRLKLL